MNLRYVGIRTLLLLPAALFVLSACTDEKIVEVPVDRPPFNPPADSVNGFLGLYDVATNLPTCGNCHVSTNAQWKTTKHATAYTSVANAPNAATACAGCHALTERGNKVALTGTGGWSSVNSDAYKNVQCESCHGPGLAHVKNPEIQANWPLARIDIRTPDSAATCGNCHSGAAHSPFAEQWKLSGHSNEELAAAEGSNASCNPCHEGRAALKRFNGNNASTYVELTGTKMLPQVCAVCHDPHGSDNPHMLRLPLNGLVADQNMCIACHLRPGRSQPSNTFTASTATVQSRGSHAPQGSVFAGQGAGWIPPGFIYDSSRVFSSHASPTANADLCAGCHVQRFVVPGPAAGEPSFTSVGHTFLPIPCVDAGGVPTGEHECGYTTTERNWSACTVSGCHTGGADVARTLFLNEKQTVQVLIDNLWKDDGTVTAGAEGWKYMDANNPNDTGLLPYILKNIPAEPATGCKKAGVPSKPFDGSDNCISVAEGALWNAMMLSKDLYAQNDGSFGTHNPFFYEALLTATIQALRNTYAGLPAVSANVEQIMQQALARPGTGFVRVGAVSASR